MSKPMNAKGADEHILGLFHHVFGWPARLQDMALNAVINTIDKIQTEQALRDAEVEDRRRAAQAKSSEGENH